MKINQTRFALYTLCVARAGYRNGSLLIEFIEDWRRCVAHLERPATIEEFIAWTRLFSRRTTFRRVDLFRRTFPELGEHGLPDGLMGPLVERLAREVEA